MQLSFLGGLAMCSDAYRNAQRAQVASLRAWAFGDGPMPSKRIVVRVEDTKGRYPPATYSLDPALGPFGAQAAALETYCVVNKYQPPAQKLFSRFRLTLPNIGIY
jgi:hypothetical protein